MINLLDTILPADEIIAVLRKVHRQPLLPSMESPAWEAARGKPPVQEWMKGIRALAEEDALKPSPPLTDELYASFFKTGLRLPFESVYFDRRRILARVAMTVLLGDETTRRKLTPALIEKIEDIMGEESWTFPAHVWTEPSGKNPMMIDLFAAETANLMGELFTVFGGILPGDLNRRIRERLRVQFFENYLKRHTEFTWTTLSMNWNAVCHQGVLGAALASEDDVEVLGRMLAISAPYLRVFLSGFGQDGSTSEGPGYWSYGFGRFTELNAQLETATGGALSFFGNSEHIRRIATFAPALAFSNGYFANFSDGDRAGRLWSVLLDYLGERLDLPILRQESAALFRHQVATGLDLQAQRCDFYCLARLCLHCPDSVTQTASPAWPDIFFADYGAVVSRGTDARGNLWEFAAKGGHNDEYHNHNDCGSYVLNFNGHPAIVEIGAPEYVRGYFGTPERYTFLASRSLGHSVPYVNGCEQPEGVKFAATVVGCKMDTDRLEFIVDLTKAYPAEARCRKLIRTFLFQKTAGLLRISDAYDLEKTGPVESILICASPITLQNGEATIQASGGALRVEPAKGTLCSGIEICEYKDRNGVTRQIYRLRFVETEEAKTGVVAYEVRAAADT